MNSSLRESRPPSFLLCVLILSAAGFCAGFFGPMIFAPDANQGPLVGIFMSGPGGAILGLLLYALIRISHVSPSRAWQMLFVCCLALVFVTLYFVMPGPAFRGYIQEVRIESCKKPADQSDRAAKYWEDEFVKSRSPATRPNWREDSLAMLQDDDGVVLEVTIIRQKKISTERKPWNNGHILAGEWQTTDKQQSFYAKYAGDSCANYASGTSTTQFNDQYFEAAPKDLGWPPGKVANYLDLQTLESIPENYRVFAEK
jgi:hypothetical protein